MYAMIIIPSPSGVSRWEEHTTTLILIPSAPSTWELGLPLRYTRGGEGSVKPRRHIFIPNVGTEECIMDFIKRYAGEKKY